MELIEFNEKCVISKLGEYNEETDTYAEDVVVYAGACRYQYHYTQGDKIKVRNDRVYLPRKAKRLTIEEGYKIRVKLEDGRVISGVISSEQTVTLPITQAQYRKIIFSQAQYE